jgi:hypothetical protein
MLIPYFGRWPEWIDLFVESCKWNPKVLWRFYSDCGEPENRADNVEVVNVTFADYKALVSERLGLRFNPTDPYKLCDVKPCLAYIHERDVTGFRFFGFGDIDVIYGDIGKVYTEELLERWDVLSTHNDRISGHFAVLRNTPRLREAFREIRNYRSMLEQPDYAGIDETPFGSVFSRRSGFRGLVNAVNALLRQSTRALFVERYTTVLSQRGWHDGTMNYPLRWYWRNGHLTNESDGDREFMYLHFMRWKSERYKAASSAAGQGSWLELERLVSVDWRRAAAEGFCISPQGFTQV